MKMFALGLDRRKISRGKMMIIVGAGWKMGALGGRGVENWDSPWVDDWRAWLACFCKST